MIKTGVAVFQHIRSGAFAFGVLCALEQIGICVDRMSVSGESAFGPLLFQKGFGLTEGTSLLSSLNKNRDLQKMIELPNQRDVTVAVLAQGRILSQDSRLYSVFGNSFSPLDANSIANPTDTAALGQQEHREKLIWVLSSLGARRIISIEGNKCDFQAEIGKVPLYTIYPEKTEEADADVLAAQGYDQILHCHRELLDTIYFTGRMGKY